jgi:hypothetical protein
MYHILVGIRCLGGASTRCQQVMIYTANPISTPYSVIYPQSVAIFLLLTTHNVYFSELIWYVRARSTYDIFLKIETSYWQTNWHYKLGFEQFRFKSGFLKFYAWNNNIYMYQ